MIGSFTFLIYLIHMPVRDFLNTRLDLNTTIENILLGHGNSSFAKELLYVLCMVVIIFLISLVIGIIINVCKYIMKFMLNWKTERL